MYKMTDRVDDRFGGMYLPCNGNRALIAACKKRGLEMFNPVGDWNGYGYDRYPMAAKIPTVKELKRFNSAVRELEERPAKRNLTDEERQAAWCKRLSKLTGIELEEAEKIANEKLEYKEQQIWMMYERQNGWYSRKRESLIRKMERENPLRRIENQEHAERIVAASRRHRDGVYDNILKRVHEMEDEGLIERGNAKSIARECVYENRDIEEVAEKY